MKWSWIGPAISAGASHINAYLNNRNAESMLHQQQDWNYETAKEFAQKGVQWRVSDAKAAGLHPLAALGVNTASGPTTTVGLPESQDYGFGKMGQAIGNFIAARLNKAELAFAKKIDLQAKQEELISRRLDNQKKLKELDAPNIGADAFATGYNLTGQGDTVKGDPRLVTVPTQIPVSGVPGIKYGVLPENEWRADAEGYVKPRLEESAAESQESDKFWQAEYFLGNVKNRARHIWHYERGKYGLKTPGGRQYFNWLRNIRDRGLPPPGPGKEWRFSPWKGAFKLYRKGKGKHGSRFYEHGPYVPH